MTEYGWQWDKVEFLEDDGLMKGTTCVHMDSGEWFRISVPFEELEKKMREELLCLK